MSIPLKEPDQPSPPWETNRLGERIERMLQRFLIGAVDAVKETIRDIIAAGIELLLEVMEPALVDMYGPMLDNLLNQPEIPADVKHAIQVALSQEHQAGAGVLLQMGAAAGGTVLTSALGVLLSESVTYPLNRSITPARPDPAVAIAASFRDPLLTNAMHEYLQDQGWSDELISVFYDLYRNRPGEGDLISAWHRGEISEDELGSELARRGWEPSDTNLLKTLSQRIPGPGDLVQFALREVYRPDLRPELLSPNAPERYYELMEKQGYDREFAEDYWAAHWQLPGVRQGFEMFWRVPDFTEGDLRDLLTRQDILPRYHDPLIDIAYNPYTRVDVRRMHDLGTLSDDETLQAYMDLGFDREKAEAMLDFTVKYNQSGERDLTKSDILGGVRDGMLSPSEAEQWLQDIEYSPEVAGYLVAREQSKVARDLLDQKLDIIEDLYTYNDIDRSEAIQRMGTLGLSSNEIDVKLEQWDIDREKRIERPSRAKLEDFLLSDIISQGEYQEQMRALGYQEQYIDWYLTEVLEKKTDQAKDEERKAREEQESVRTRRLKTDYQTEKAAIDVDIAEIRSAIADTQLAIDARRARYRRQRRVAEQTLTEHELKEQARKEVATLERRINARRQGIAAARSDIEELQSDIQRLELQLQERRENAQADIDAIEGDIDTLEEEIDTHQEQITTLQTQIQRIQGQIEALRRNPALLDIDADIAEIEQAIETRQIDIDLAETEIQDLRTDIARLEEQLPQRLQAAGSEAEANEIESQAEQQILTWERQIEELRGEIERHQDVIATQRDELRRLENQKEGLAAQRDINQLRLDIEGIEGEIRQEREIIASLRSEIGRKQNQLRLLRQPAQTTLTRIEAKRVEIEDLQTDIANLRAEIEGYEGEIRERHDRLEEDIATLDQLPRLEEIEAAYQADISEFEERLGTLQANLQQLKEDKARLEFEYRQSIGEG